MEALGRITDRANQPCSQIFETACVVDDGEGSDVVEQRVDREVAPEGILLGSAKRVLTVDEPIGTLTLRPAGVFVLTGLEASSAAASSSAVTLRRKVATSIVLAPNRTCASRNRRPITQQFLNRRLT